MMKFPDHVSEANRIERNGINQIRKENRIKYRLNCGMIPFILDNTNNLIVINEKDIVKRRVTKVMK